MTQPPHTDRFYYLASPYSHPSPLVRAQRTIDVGRYAGEMMAAGMFVYSPIWATHDAAVRHALPADHEWWLGFNKAFIDASAGVVVCGIDGWRESRGVAQEIEYARSWQMPVWLATEGRNGLEWSELPASRERVFASPE